MSKQPTASTFMPLRGEKRWAYLSRQKNIRLATNNEDGSIYIYHLFITLFMISVYCSPWTLLVGIVTTHRLVGP